MFAIDPRAPRRYQAAVSIQQDDIVAVGGDLDPGTLVRAYQHGIFPWPVEGLPLLWFCPRERAILDFADLHVGRSLARARRRSTLRFTVDAAFPAVIRACADMPRPGQEGTWITPGIAAAYGRLHALGVAHSVEAWRGETLVAGVYGVDVDGAFAAESMFHREPDASKLALLHLVDVLRAGGLDWFDVQVMTPHLERLGTRAIPRRDFLARLARTRARGLRPFG
jgi:leucyl/phenylalanyl-tRNA--protein transferase